MTAPPFPLPMGHFFGLMPGDLRCHDGRGVLDSIELRKWQATYSGRWRRPRYAPSGRYDGPTQRAVLEVQGVLGLAATGLLGTEEWAAVWERLPPEPKEPEPTEEDRKQQAQKVRDYWAKFSKWKVRYGQDPNAPPWYPGRPFGLHEKGPHISKVRELLGLAPTPPLFTAELARRVRGFQQARGFPVSGVVDVRTASALDPLEQDETPRP